MSGVPTNDFLAGLHQLLLDGNNSNARTTFAEAVLAPLIGSLKRPGLPHRDFQIVVDAAIDAMMEFLLHPQKYDPAKGTVFGFLRMAAHRNATNTLLAEHRLMQRIIRRNF